MPPEPSNRLIRLLVSAVAALGMVALVVLLVPGDRPARAQGGEGQARSSTLRPGVETRTARIPTRTRAARAGLRRRLGSEAVVETDGRTGGVRLAARLDGALTGRGEGGATTRALGYVRERPEVFGLDAGDLGGLELASRERDPGGRVTRVRWRQLADGIPLLEGDLRATVAQDGRILSVAGGARADLAEDAETRPRLDAVAARRIAARATRDRRPVPRVRRAARVGDRAARFSNRDEASLVLTQATGELRLAWRVIRAQSPEETYDQLIDARSGEEIRRQQRVTHASGHVLDNHPGAAQGGAGRLVPFDADLANNANQLVGPAAHVYTDVDGDGTTDPGESVPPTSAGGDWNYPRRAVAGTNCPAAGCSWTPGTAGSWQLNQRQSGTQLFHFLRTFRRHLASQPIGFDDFLGSDGISARALAGADGPNGLPIDGDHINNAAMDTRPEGTAPIMSMFLWASTRNPIPAVNSADDASIVYHEYTHGLASRLVIDSMGWGALSLRQSGAINEGLADFYALDYLHGQGLERDGAAAGDVKIGKHVDPQLATSRKQGVDCPVGGAAPTCPGTPGAGPGGFTYGDFSKINGGHEVHFDGEIVTQTMWDLRARLIADHGEPEGLRRLRSLLTFALRDVPPDPSFLDLRNALLRADAAPGAGGDADRVWAVFAARGMGYFASSQDGDDATPHEDFSLPPADAPGAVRGVVSDADGSPLANATVSLGGHDSGELFPSDLRARTDADGAFRIAGVPAGTYRHLTVERPGHEAQVLRDVTVGAGDAVRNVTLRRNWADMRSGAELTNSDGEQFASRGCGAAAAFDGDRTRGWATPGARAHSAEVTLPADVRLSSVALDPTPRCETGDNAVPGRVTVEAASESGSFGPAVDFRPRAGSVRGLMELRPPAPLDEVRRVRVTMHGPVDPKSPYSAISELMVFASRKAPPRAAFTWDPRVPDVKQNVVFSAADSRPGSSPIVRHEWDLDGNGSYERDTDLVPQTDRAFDEGGRHEVGLRLTNAEGETDEIRHTVSVGTGLELFDLGTLEAGETGSAHANGVTADGLVLGQTRPGARDGEYKAFRYRAGDMEQLERLRGHDYGVALNGGDNGLTAGMSGTVAGGLADARPVLWSGTRPEDLGTLGGPRGFARDVDESGTVVGHAQNAQRRERPFIKPLFGPMRDIEELAQVPPAERGDAAALRMSPNGKVAGCRNSSFTDCGGHGFRYDSATQQLDVLPDLGRSAAPIGINDAGVAGGWVSELNGSLTPARWTAAGALEQLQTLGGPQGSGIDVTPGGTVFGEAEALDGVTRAVRWQPGSTQAEDLNDLVKGSGWRLESAQAVNDRGDIVGHGSNGDGSRRAFQLSTGPCRMCIDDVELEERDVATGDWQPVGGDGTVDGNRVRARIKVRNADSQPHDARVRGVDENRSDEALERSGEAVSLNPRETAEVTLELDTEGRAWTAEGKPDADHVLRFRLTLGHTIFTSRGAALKVRPKPLVLVHGMASDASTWASFGDFAKRAHPDWETFAVGDGRAPGIMDTGSFGSLAATPNTIRQNAHVMAGYVAGVRQAEDAERVEVVAHSMGGLISRRYIQDEMPQPRDPASSRPVVGHLIQLGTPNMGSPCADLTGLDMQYELRTDVAAQFNNEVTDRRGVPFSIFAGDPFPFTCHSGEDGDSVVGLSSALWEIADRTKAPVLHTAMTANGSTFTSFVKPRLSGEVAVPAAPSNGFAAAAAPEPVRPRSHQFVGRRTLTVPPGTGSAEATFEVDSGARLELTLLAPPDVSAELVAPNGDVAASSPSGTREARSGFRRLRADAPAAGAWKVRLGNGGAVPTQAQAIARVTDDRWELDLQAGRAAAGAKTPFVATVARAGRRLAGAGVTVAVRRPGRPDQNVALHDDGRHGDGAAADGCYAAEADVASGGALLTMRAGTGSGERLRETWADVAAPSGEGRAVACPRGSGRNGEIHFQASVNGGTPGWHALDPAGPESPLPGLPGRRSDVVLSADGERAAWSSGDDLLVAAHDGTAQRTVIQGGDDLRLEPAWSPDATELAYSKRCLGEDDRYTDCGLFIVDVATGAERPVAGTAAIAGRRPSWSPDGSSIAFTGEVDGGCDRFCPAKTDIHTIRADGTGLRRVTRGARGADEAAWSPDGARIAFSRLDSTGEATGTADQEIYTVEPDGSGLENLTNDPDCSDNSTCALDDRDLGPVWSPDGRRIAFVSDRGEPTPGNQLPRTSQVWTMRPDGTGRAKLTTSATDKSDGRLSWRSVPYLATQAAPDCRDLTVRTRPGTAVDVPLDCADANGDALSLELLGAPRNGSLSAIGAGGNVTYTPRAGFEGSDSFEYRASDDQDASLPATVTVEVVAPPPPPPPPPPRPPMPPIFTGGGGSSGGGGGSGSGSGSDPGGNGPVVRIPGDCTVDPRTGFCMVQVGCGPGSDISGRTGCTHTFTQVTRRATAAGTASTAAGEVTTARRRKPPILFKAVKVTVAAGKTKRVRLGLTKRGLSELRRRRSLKIAVQVETRQGGKVVSRTKKTVRFRLKKRR